MKAEALTLRELFDVRGQWLVPVYQRHYAWTIDKDKQLVHLWTDLKNQIKNNKGGNKITAHYFGAIIISQRPRGATVVPENILVDGQQRITTFKLVLIALREVARTLEIAEQVSDIQKYLYIGKGDEIKNPEKEKYKLWPSYFDRENFKKIVDSQHQDLPQRFSGCFDKDDKIVNEGTPNTLLAYDFLYNKLLQYVEECVGRNSSKENAQKEIIGKILKTFLDGFQVVFIEIEDADDPQQIFASLNGLAEPLSPADLIRNDIFHRAKKEKIDPESLYKRKWLDEFEQDIWANKVLLGKIRKRRIDHFIGHFVVAETAKITDIKRIVSEYRHHVKEYQSAEHEIDALLVHAKTYKALTSDIDESNSLFRLKAVFDHWNISIFYPLVMAIKKKEFSSATEEKFFQLIENYIVRRTLCGLTQQNYNNVVSDFVRVIKDGPDQLKKFLERLSDPKTGNKARLPLFDEVLDKCQTKAIYPKYSKQIPYILSKLNEEKRKKYKHTEKISIQEKLSVEHIMPRKWHKHWPLPSGDEATNSEHLHLESGLSEKGKDEFGRRVRLINTIGNLTLVNQPLNSSLSNGSWSEKRGEEGLGQSILALNKELVVIPKWNEDEIVKRSTDFAKLVEKIWPADVELY